MNAVPPPSPLDARLLAALERLAQALAKGRWDAAYARGLSATQAQLLLYTASQGDPPLRVGRLADAFSLKHSTVSDALAALEAKGLAVRSSDPTDARATCVQLTRRGRQLAQQLGGWSELLRQHLASLPREQQGLLLATLLDLIARLQQAGWIHVSRCCTTCLYFQRDAHANPAAPHHCRLLDQPLHLVELRVDCPDHQPAEAAAP